MFLRIPLLVAAFTRVLAQEIYTGNCFLNGDCLGTIGGVPPYNGPVQGVTISCSDPNLLVCAANGYSCCVGILSDGKTVVNVCCTTDQWLLQEVTSDVYYPVIIA